MASALLTANIVMRAVDLKIFPVGCFHNQFLIARFNILLLWETVFSRVQRRCSRVTPALLSEDAAAATHGLQHRSLRLVLRGLTFNLANSVNKVTLMSSSTQDYRLQAWPAWWKTLSSMILLISYCRLWFTLLKRLRLARLAEERLNGSLSREKIDSVTVSEYLEQ